MRKGDLIQIRGAHARPATVLGCSDILLIVQFLAGDVAYLRRDVASTKPLQWRLDGMPVEVCEMAGRHADFSKKLAALEKKTRRSK